MFLGPVETTWSRIQSGYLEFRQGNLEFSDEC